MTDCCCFFGKKIYKAHWLHLCRGVRPHPNIHVIYICMITVCCFRQRIYLPQGLVNEVLNETWTHSCLQFESLFTCFGCGVLYKGYSPFFFGCVYFWMCLLLLLWMCLFTVYLLVCLTPLWYLICLLLCARVHAQRALGWFWVSLTVIFLLSVCMWVCILGIFCV